MRRFRPGAIGAIVGRDFAIARSYKLALLFDAFFGVIELAVYYFISELFGDFTPADLQGAPTYFAFAAVGAILSAVIIAASAGVAVRLREEQLTGTLEALMSHPVSSVEACFGFTGFPFLFALFRAFLYLLVAGAWMDLDLSQVSLLGVCVVLVCAGFAFTSLGILSGAIVIVLKRGDVLTGTALFAMALLSGSLFPISTLPDQLEPIGQILPLRFAFDGVRAALFGGEGWQEHAGVLAAFAAASLPLALVAFSVALRYAKRTGTLGQY